MRYAWATRKLQTTCCLYERNFALEFSRRWNRSRVSDHGRERLLHRAMQNIIGIANRRCYLHGGDSSKRDRVKRVSPRVSNHSAREIFTHKKIFESRCKKVAGVNVAQYRGYNVQFDFDLNSVDCYVIRVSAMVLAVAINYSWLELFCNILCYTIPSLPLLPIYMLRLFIYKKEKISLVLVSTTEAKINVKQHEWNGCLSSTETSIFIDLMVRSSFFFTEAFNPAKTSSKLWNKNTLIY